FPSYKGERKQARKSEEFAAVTHKQGYPRNTMATQEAPTRLVRDEEQHTGGLLCNV
ncbi:hypothetical protein L9F63_006228, partial [Diploptera punctata]